MNPYPSISLVGVPDFLEGVIPLPGSKSESNRALILKAQAEEGFYIHNLSEAEDTACLSGLLDKVEKRNTGQNPLVLDVGPAGTAMRFLTAYLSLLDGEFILTGSPRMLERPVRILVDALKSLGADIEYMGVKGFPPIHIRGKKWTGQKIAIHGNISSQYISALLLIGPSTRFGLEIEILGELTSAPYVEMTLQMMHRLGIKIIKKEKGWYVPAGKIGKGELEIEPDWSAASYWYALASLAGEFNLEIPGLTENSLQADKRIASIMENFGVQTQFHSKGIVLSPKFPISIPSKLDFKTCPDIAQTLLVLGSAWSQEIFFSGLATLKIKETDRVKALTMELAKIGVEIVENDSEAQIRILSNTFPGSVSFNTYHDHRMAMALTPLIYRVGKVEIENYKVVNKSYPGFWRDLESVGFGLV